MALVTSSSSASSSNIISPSQLSYHVFLSFRGEDTRKTFTDHLYTALTDAGFRTFRDDDELLRGEDIKPELKKAIQQSRSSVVVFSKDYASSGWCLDELVMILERKRTSNHVVLPVFYDIDPSHVRKQTGSVAKAFARHGKKQAPEKLKRWREALTQVADLAGMVLQNQDDGHEAKFIKKIVKVIEDKLCRRGPLSVITRYLVGIQDRVKYINFWLQDGSSDVGICGICGLGGIGKTTIAQVVYNSNFERFAGSSFIANVREISEQPNGLVQVQKQLLSDIFNGGVEKIRSVSEGITKIKDVIGSKKVLLVLDDVDHREQLDAVLSMRDSFCPGSKIIITTRHAGLLKARQVKVHNVVSLTRDQSLELFSWHSFGQDHPVEGYVEVSESIVHHCEGLPLALQILGSSLSGQSLDYWENALKKLKDIPNGEISSKLRISYDSLQDDHDQNLFLHIACFFIAKEKDVIIRILDGCDFYTIVGIQNLIDRCLVTIDIENRVKMHQMIRDMGRGIVRLESKEPGKRSRLWHPKDSLQTLRENNGSEAIEGLSLNMNMYHVSTTRNSDVVLETTAFSSMRQLRLLELCGVQLDGSYQEFPKGLRWLCWDKYPLHSLPNDFVLENLVVLEMHYGSNLKQVWKGTKHLPSLKTLDLSHSHGLTETGDFSLVPNLERLILVGCASLVAIHESIGKLKKLVYLNMTDCKVIRKLPDNITMLKFLETLIISGCSNLNELPMEMSKMESLKVLQADTVAIKQLLNIATATATGPGKSLNNYWTLPSTLVDLSLTNCNLSDDDFPRDFGNLSSLYKLNLGGNAICSLPDCVRGLKGLDYLGVGECMSLKSLIGLPRTRQLVIDSCASLEKVTFQSLSCLPEMMHLEQWLSNQLVEIEHWYKLEAIGRVDVEMINLLGLCNLEPNGMKPIRMQTPGAYGRTMEIQGLYECGIFSTFFSGTVNEVPGEFSYSSSGDSSIPFTVPLLPNHRIRGLNIYCVYAEDSCKTKFTGGEPVIIVVRNKSKGLKWIYWPSWHGIPSKKQDMIWLSHWKFGNQLEAGDHVTASVHGIRSASVEESLCDYVVKEWGIRIVHEEEDNMSRQLYNSYTRDDNCYDGQDHPDDDANAEMIGIGGYLSEFYKLMPGMYLIVQKSSGGGPIKGLTGFPRSALYMIGGSDEETDDEEGSEPDRMVAAAEAEERGGISKYGIGGWRGRGCKFLIMAAVFFFSVSLFSHKRKRQPTRSP